MKHLKSFKFVKSFNEEVKFEWEWDPECVRLQNIINSYNNQLFNDDVWKKFYHHIPLYYQKQKDSEFLESIIEFGKKRIEEIKKENTNLLEDVKDIFQEFDDDVDFIKEIKYNLIDGNLKDGTIIPFKLIIDISLNEGVNDLTYIGLLPYYTQFAIENIWTNISIVTKRLKTLNLNCHVNYTVSKEINLILKLN